MDARQCSHRTCIITSLYVKAYVLQVIICVARMIMHTTGTNIHARSEHCLTSISYVLDVNFLSVYLEIKRSLSSSEVLSNLKS